MNLKQIFLLSVALTILVTACVPQEKQCSVDNDCVPATCCHPADAVNTNNAPGCSGVLCTAECKPGTIDCSQGEIKCVNNKCTVELY